MAAEKNVMFAKRIYRYRYDDHHDDDEELLFNHHQQGEKETHLT